MKLKSLAVFCGSKEGKDPIFKYHAEQLGKLLAANDVKLIYGGGSAGIMGIISDCVMKNGGQVTGIIPKLLLEWERQHRGITELIIADDMHERKKMIYSLCDAALILPGGFGTMDEFFEIVTWNQLTIHDKNIFILNSNGFYQHLIGHIQKMKDEKFLYPDSEERIFIINDPMEILPWIQ